MGSRYDVVVGGGSIAGLTFACEAAKKGLKVLVVEEHETIGEPEKCDGLVSLRGLRRYGYQPKPDVMQSRIDSAVISAPSGSMFELGASFLEVVVLARSRFDQQVASNALDAGAKLLTGKRAGRIKEADNGISLFVGSENLEASYYVDATGPASSPTHGILPAAKYEVEGNWIREGKVEVYIDPRSYPGFFAWVIPYGENLAKVGVAGRGIDSFASLDRFLLQRPCKVLRKVAAPIYIGGPAQQFVNGRLVKVGESAGQVKPTTGGGIMTSIAGAVSAARWVSQALEKDDPDVLLGYQKEWEADFLKEMKDMLRLRKVFEHLSSREADSLIEIVSAPKVLSELSRSDFDFHATSLLRVMGVRGMMKLARVVASAEARALLVRK